MKIIFYLTDQMKTPSKLLLNLHNAQDSNSVNYFPGILPTKRQHPLVRMILMNQICYFDKA
jgi:hypothetical protein